MEKAKKMTKAQLQDHFICMIEKVSDTAKQIKDGKNNKTLQIFLEFFMKHRLEEAIAVLSAYTKEGYNEIMAKSEKTLEDKHKELEYFNFFLMKSTTEYLMPAKK